MTLWEGDGRAADAGFSGLASSTRVPRDAQGSLYPSLNTMDALSHRG